jgi:hypothetical protein
MYLKDKAAYIEYKLFIIMPGYQTIGLTVDDILNSASPEFIDFIYHKLRESEEATQREYLNKTA